MSKFPKSIEFKEGGYFYNMIFTFTSAIAGLRSLIDSQNPMKLREDGPPVRLDGKVHTGFTYNPYDHHKKFIKGELSYPVLLNSLCQMLINTAYESVKDKSNLSPEFEFFRHIRHASSHNNLFFFKSQEPKREAKWRGKIIDHTKKGQNNPLFGTRCFSKYLGPSDPVLLLWDIEQILIKI